MSRPTSRGRGELPTLYWMIIVNYYKTIIAVDYRTKDNLQLAKSDLQLQRNSIWDRSVPLWILFDWSRLGVQLRGRLRGRTRRFIGTIRFEYCKRYDFRNLNREQCSRSRSSRTPKTSVKRQFEITHDRPPLQPRRTTVELLELWTFRFLTNNNTSTITGCANFNLKLKRGKCFIANEK